MTREEFDGRLDEMRMKFGFLTLAEVLNLRGLAAVFDPYSVLVARRAHIGPGTVIYPGVTIECDGESECTLGAENVLMSGTRIVARGGGVVRIGDANTIGDGGARILADQPHSRIEVASRTRLLGGAEITGTCRLGDGSQILGPIRARSVTLDGGKDWTWPDPDMRGAVLKGPGTGAGIRLGIGEVLNGLGSFEHAQVEPQRWYHQDAPRT